MKVKVTATYRSNGRLIKAKMADSMREADKIIDEFFLKYNSYLVDVGYELMWFKGPNWPPFLLLTLLKVEFINPT